MKGRRATVVVVVGASVLLLLLPLMLLVSSASTTATATNDSTNTKLKVCLKLRSDMRLSHKTDLDEFDKRLEKEVFDCYSELVDNIFQSPAKSEVADNITNFFLSSSKTRATNWRQTAKVFLMNLFLTPSEEEREDIDTSKRVDSLLFYSQAEANFTGTALRELLKELLHQLSKNELSLTVNQDSDKKLAVLLSRMAEILFYIECDSPVVGAAFQQAVKRDATNPIANWGYGAYLTVCDPFKRTSPQKKTGVGHLNKVRQLLAQSMFKIESNKRRRQS